jgi:hypothetical protein
MKTVSEEVTDMIFLSKWSSRTLCAGAELGVFDYLSCDGTRAAGDIAAETGLDPTLTKGESGIDVTAPLLSLIVRAITFP